MCVSCFKENSKERGLFNGYIKLYIKLTPMQVLFQNVRNESCIKFSGALIGNKFLFEKLADPLNKIESQKG